MASLQEHLQINQSTLDKWSTREQMCLASVVLGSGDEDWTTVSSNMKLLCGTNRPTDWFSHKTCAAQYKELLENAETRKKDAQSEEDIAIDTPLENSAQTTKHLILKQLTHLRMQEIEAEIRKEQEEYARINAEIKLVQSGQLKDEEIIAMWKEIQKEQEMQRIEEMKMENQLREREQRNQDMQRNWRAAVGSALITPNYDAIKKEEKNLSLQEIIGTSKTIPSGDQQQATSPLLSSLLKSPTPTCSSPTLSTIAHVTAPTITTLLTGGAINSNQPAITLKNTIPASEAAHLLSRPISGPPTESVSVLANASHTLLSPSQSAPTLSMLLEKNKVTNILNTATTNVATTFSVEPAKVNKIDRSVSDSNNEEVPMDIEEDVVTAVANATDLVGVDDSDADASEEQQLLEVFKNLGNIDDLEDIDVAAVINEEVDFLKSVEDEHADGAEGTENEKSDSNQLQNLPKNLGTANKVEKISEAKDKEAHNIQKINDVEADEQKEEMKIETSSSDDSDDIPLSTLGSSASPTNNKDILNKSQDNLIDTITKDQLDRDQTEAQYNTDEERIPNDEETLAGSVNGSEEHDEAAPEVENAKEVEPTSIPSQKSPRSDNSDVIIIPTDDESNGGDKQEEFEKTCEDEAQQQPFVDKGSTNDVHEELDKYKDLHPPEAVESVDESTHSTTKEAEMETNAPRISLADTDDDSSQTIAVSTTTQNDEKVAKQPSVQSNKEIEEAINVDRKLKEETTFSQTPAKPPVIKKLREHERSESPITNVDDDTTASEHSVTQRSRRRYSSTPLNDSIPNSPTPSDRDDRDAKSSKKSLLSLYNSLMSCKSAAAFQRAYSEQSSKIKDVCNRNIDFQIIKRNIETGSTRNMHDLQRDFFLLCQNCIMVFKSNSANYKIVCDFKQDCQNVKEFLSNGKSCERASRTEKENKDIRTSTSSHASSTHSSVVKVRGSSRKSQRITST